MAGSRATGRQANIAIRDVIPDSQSEEESGVPEDEDRGSEAVGPLIRNVIPDSQSEEESEAPEDEDRGSEAVGPSTYSNVSSDHTYSVFSKTPEALKYLSFPRLPSTPTDSHNARLTPGLPSTSSQTWPASRSQPISQYFESRQHLLKIDTPWPFPFPQFFDHLLAVDAATPGPSYSIPRFISQKDFAYFPVSYYTSSGEVTIQDLWSEFRLGNLHSWVLSHAIRDTNRQIHDWVHAQSHEDQLKNTQIRDDRAIVNGFQLIEYLGAGFRVSDGQDVPIPSVEWSPGGKDGWVKIGNLEYNWMLNAAEMEQLFFSP